MTLLETLMASGDLFRLTDCKQIKGYLGVDRETGDDRFYRLKFPCYRFTIIHAQARPDAVNTIVASQRNGMWQFTVTTSHGVKKSLTLSDFHRQIPAKYGNSVYQAICHKLF